MTTLQRPKTEGQMPPSLFDYIPRCHACADLGVVYNSDGVFDCWRRKPSVPHNEPTAAGRMVARALTDLYARGGSVNTHTLDVAIYLSQHTSAEPCKREHLAERYFRHAADPKRVLAKTIEDLRSEWLLPVGARKDAPSGYWIITDIDDFADYVERAKAAPVTQLRTIYTVAKRNFPAFAGQLELDFLSETEQDFTEIKEAA